MKDFNAMTNDELYSVIDEIRSILHYREACDTARLTEFVNILFEDFDESLNTLKDKILAGLESLPTLYKVEQKLKYGDMCYHFVVSYRYQGKTVTYGIYTTVTRFTYETEEECCFITNIDDYLWAEFNLPKFLQGDHFETSCDIRNGGIYIVNDTVVDCDQHDIPEPLWLLSMLLMDTSPFDLELPIVRVI